MTNFSIFISRDEEDASLLQEFCEKQKLALVPKALIEFIKTPYIISEKWDVIFFPSPRAVDFFFDQPDCYDFSDTEIACAGKGTKSALKNWVNKIHFIPKNSGNIVEVQREFKEWLKNRNVLFVGSNLSRKSVLSEIPPGQQKFIQVYETKDHPQIIEPCNLYIFSSPSNVKSFLTMNQIPVNSSVISWGQSTTIELIKNGITPVFELKSSCILELVKYLKENLKE
ncbi:MAG: hypothetical protein FJX84_05390 [Bacteroidetes bacterium]|nr:hypothetical protein [Bacteroidota bacterium]